MPRFGFFFGGRPPQRNEGILLADPHPVERYRDDLDTGNAGLDGYTTLSRALPDRQGDPPPVDGVIGPAPRGPAEDWEQ